MTRHEVSLQELQKWIGHQEKALDVVTPELAKRMRATLSIAGPPPKVGDIAPLGIHWCLGLPAAQTSSLGPDGNPRRGDFLPPVSLPRRMWAGGELRLLSPIHVGDEIGRTSTVQDVVLKKGSSGPLCFVTVVHEFANQSQTVLRERHDIVYRDIAANDQQPSRPGNMEDLPRPKWQRTIAADPTLLFRYSALTFNSHRIHYDRDYCLNVAKYPGLVFHGPLQATLLVHLAEEVRGKSPALFSFRSTAPIFDGGDITFNAREDGDGLALWTADQAGKRAMSAMASW